MINLLPPELKTTYRYGRRNRTLFKWSSAMAAGLLGAILLTGAGYLYLHQSIRDYTSQIGAANQQLEAADFTAVEGKVKAISNNLKLANQVLSKEILFSELLKRLGSVTPPNVILTDLSITQTRGGIDLTAQTADYAAAAQLQANLSDPKNQIFSKADIISINCSGQSQAYSNYPCTANLRALFASDNPFLFINSGKGSGS